MITKFKQFEEASFKDLVNIDKLTDKKLLDIINRPFQEDVKLIKQLDKKSDLHILFNIQYNDKDSHSIIERIKTRTSLQSVSDFNTILSKGLVDFIENNDQLELSDKVKKNEKERKLRFSIYFEEYKFYLIFSINSMRSINNVEKGEFYDIYNIYEVSILNKSDDTNIKFITKEKL